VTEPRFAAVEMVVDVPDGNSPRRGSTSVARNGPAWQAAMLPENRSRRISAVAPEVCDDGHLVAEHFAVARLFSMVREAELRGARPSDLRGVPAPHDGPGHMLFFYTRLGWAAWRWSALCGELARRGRSVRASPDMGWRLGGWAGGWEPTLAELAADAALLGRRGALLPDPWAAPCCLHHLWPPRGVPFGNQNARRRP
jgi:deoxyribonuclease (pyrimidine dimer)